MKAPFSTAIRFLSASAVLLSAGSAWAGLEFDNTTLEKKAGHSDESAEAIFKFKVTGDKPVTINDVQSFCSCLKAKVKDDKKVFNPGDTGELETAFQLGTFEGEVSKQVVVHSDDVTGPDVPLTVKITIPPLFSIEPNNVVWNQGDKPDPKIMRVKMLGDQPVKIISAKASRPTIQTDIKTIEEGKLYDIVVTPTTTDLPVLGMVVMETDCKFARYQKRLLFFNVKRQRLDATGAPVPAPPGAPATPPAPGGAAPASAPGAPTAAGQPAAGTTPPGK